MKIEEDMAYIDFYRRQYWNELRFNTRKYDDESIDFKMPPFSLFRQFGGVLPPANGYNFTNSYTVKNDAYTDVLGSLMFFNFFITVIFVYCQFTH